MVLVSHSHRFIFLKTRKTAGTSIEMLLEPLCAAPGHVVTERNNGHMDEYGVIGHRRSTAPRLPDLPAHLPAGRLRRLLPREQWRSYFRFSSLRNPFDKAVSQFFWDRDSKALPRLCDRTAIRAAFHEFLGQGKLRNDFSIAHRKGRYILDDFIRYERLADDLDRISGAHGLDVQARRLPRAKSSTSRPRDMPVAEYYGRDAADAVRSQLAWIFERGDYSRNPEDADAVRRLPEEVCP